MLPPSTLSDAQAALAAGFARPEALGLLLTLLPLAVLDLWAKRRRGRGRAAVGRPAAGEALRPSGVLGRGAGLAAFPLGHALLIMGLAGPQWGRSGEGGTAVGRDLVVVVDVSRSMSADDMAAPPGTRFDAAKAAVLDLLKGVSRRGGHRVGVVAFAAFPVVLCPLTTDYDHAKAVAGALDGRFPPPGCRPGDDPAAVSGTRIGAGLAAAVALHDPRFPGAGHRAAVRRRRPRGRPGMAARVGRGPRREHSRPRLRPRQPERRQPDRGGRRLARLRAGGRRAAGDGDDPPARGPAPGRRGGDPRDVCSGPAGGTRASASSSARGSSRTRAGK